MSTTIERLSGPDGELIGGAPTEGDYCRFTTVNGEGEDARTTIIETEYHAPPLTPPSVDLRPRPLTPNELIDLLVSVMGSSEFGSAWADPQLVLFVAKMQCAIEPFRKDSDTIIDGLMSFQTEGHLTEEQRSTILDSWPTS